MGERAIDVWDADELMEYKRTREEGRKGGRGGGRLDR